MLSTVVLFLNVKEIFVVRFWFLVTVGFCCRSVNASGQDETEAYSYAITSEAWLLEFLFFLFLYLYLFSFVSFITCFCFAVWLLQFMIMSVGIVG